MATSGTATFDMDFTEIAEEAWERAGREMRSGYDLRTARRSMNLMTIEWQNRGINLWTVEEGSVSLTESTSQYTLPADTIDLIEQVIRTNSGNTTTQSDITLNRIGVSAYSSIPNKLSEGRPIQMWIDRQRDAPVLNLWPVPDKSDTYVIRYWRIRRIQDAGNGVETADMNFRFLPCLVAGLAYNIALKIPELVERVPMLKEIYDEAPIDPETNLPMLNANWFSSKETIEKIYKSNPKLFPEWKDGIGNWNSLTDGFLAGKFKKVKGKRVYTGDKVDSASLLVSGADSPAKKATKDFEKAVAKKLNVDSIKPQEQTLKYLNFIRLSESDELLKNSDKFFKKYNFDDLTTPGTKLNENFEKFKILDDKRKVLRDDPAIQAVIKKIFPDTEVKFDVAHTFELGQVKKGKVSKSKLGKGGDPDEMYIDLSITNRSIQKDLESKAKQLEEIYTQTGDSEILEALQKISKKMSDLGVKGETVTKVGDLQSGFILGKKGENLSDKLQALAERQGVKLTDADYEILLKADNIINPPRPFKSGGMVGISHLTRPL